MPTADFSTSTPTTKKSGRWKLHDVNGALLITRWKSHSRHAQIWRTVFVILTQANVLSLRLVATKLVYQVGIEPTHPEGTDLQSAAALQLDR